MYVFVFIYSTAILAVSPVPTLVVYYNQVSQIAPEKINRLFSNENQFVFYYICKIFYLLSNINTYKQPIHVKL